MKSKRRRLMVLVACMGKMRHIYEILVGKLMIDVGYKNNFFFIVTGNAGSKILDEVHKIIVCET
jgi:hypothetical protein